MTHYPAIIDYKMPDLEQYGQKRDFEKTSEPPPAAGGREGPLIFVVQKHSARRLHYDFRLEVDGVLKSWAVPKGPSLDPSQKRLAALVEDHPIDYASFEGSIPKGEYGAGEVIVWDYGTYSPDEGGTLLFDDREKAQAEMRRGISSGKIGVLLRGEKLKGSWTLVKVKAREKDWLLIKHRDEFASTSVDILSEGRSVVTGRTMDDVKSGAAPPTAGAPPLNIQRLEGIRRSSFPGFVAPMLASTADAPFSNPEWRFEPKLDGYRTIAAVRDGDITLWSRRGLNVTDRFASVAGNLGHQPVSQAVFDGEMVAVDERGNVSFEALQQNLHTMTRAHGGSLVYYVFDILYLDGYDLTGVPLDERRRVLRSLFRESADVRLVESFESDGKTVFEAALKNGLEGVIAKKSDSLYQPGRRSGDWLKVKAMHTGDFIIGGYTSGEGNRKGALGALLLGYLDNKNDLIYAGHVGSGFNEESLAEMKDRLDRIKAGSCPFAEEPQTNASPTWVRPELVAEVKYSQWTRDGRLRIPVFLRLREDKPAVEARRTEVVEAPDAVAGPSKAETVARLVEELSTDRDSFAMEVEGNRLELGNLNKELWPGTKTHPAVTKRQLLTYLAKVSPYLLPHLKDRPLTLSRYPNGIHGEHFWQKHWNFALPEFVSTVYITDETAKKGEYIMCNNLSTLVWLGQAADIEFHTWYSRADARPDMTGKESTVDRILDYPDFIVLDVDPYIYSGNEKPGDEPELNRTAFEKSCEVALWLKEILDGLSLNAFVKTSGKTGLHLYIPIVRNLEYRAARKAAETIGQFLLQRHPREITMEWATEKRKGKVFIDYAQNVRGKTLASVYSPRPNDEAGVSFPLRWDEVGKVYPTDFTVLSVPELLKERGDSWARILDAKKDLSQALGIR